MQMTTDRVSFWGISCHKFTEGKDYTMKDRPHINRKLLLLYIAENHRKLTAAKTSHTVSSEVKYDVNVSSS